MRNLIRTEEIFQRYEKKYLLNERQYLGLMSSLASKMTVDQYGRHTIQNIYFDTEDYQMIRTSIEKPAYKEKLRVRSYGITGDEDFVYIELKKKIQGIVYKRRIPMRLLDARKYLYYGIYPEKDSQVIREVSYVLSKYNAKPVVYLSYERIAFYGNANQDLRVTFDTNIRARQSALDLSQGNYGSRILSNQQLLMEVKIPGAMPVWMSHLFSELGIYPTAFSKYGTYYRQFIAEKYFVQGGKICA